MVWNCIKSVTGTGYGVCYMFRIMISRNGDVMSGDRWFMIVFVFEVLLFSS